MYSNYFLKSMSSYNIYTFFLFICNPNNNFMISDSNVERTVGLVWFMVFNATFNNISVI